MKIENVIAFVFVVLLVFTVLFVDYSNDKSRIIVYDCDIIDLYKNIPEEVKRECKNISKEENKLKEEDVKNSGRKFISV